MLVMTMSLKFKSICGTSGFHAKMMGDIMYLYQALKQYDPSEFIKAVIKVEFRRSFLSIWRHTFG